MKTLMIAGALAAVLIASPALAQEVPVPQPAPIDRRQDFPAEFRGEWCRSKTDEHQEEWRRGPCRKMRGQIYIPFSYRRIISARTLNDPGEQVCRPLSVTEHDARTWRIALSCRPINCGEEACPKGMVEEHTDLFSIDRGLMIVTGARLPID